MCGFWEVLREIFEALKFRGLTAYRKHSQATPLILDVKNDFRVRFNTETKY